MNISALITMLAVHITVTAFTGYYFYKVLFMKPKENVNAEKDEE
jgi:hypothetical protein